jgi:hypothetical protein
MNFELFDDDFEKDKFLYLKEIYDLSDKQINPSFRGDWNSFVASTMVSTRAYYIIVTALKVMQNLAKTTDFDNCVFNALPFMPDQEFVETVVLVVAKYHEKGIELAKHFGVDTSKVGKPKINPVPQKQETKKDVKK